MLAGDGEEDVEDVYIGMVLRKLPGIAQALACHALVRNLAFANSRTRNLADADDGCCGIRVDFPDDHAGFSGAYFQTYENF